MSSKTKRTKRTRKQSQIECIDFLPPPKLEDTNITPPHVKSVVTCDGDVEYTLYANNKVVCNLNWTSVRHYKMYVDSVDLKLDDRYKARCYDLIEDFLETQKQIFNEYARKLRSV